MRRRKRWISRGESSAGPLGGEQRAREPAQLVGDGEALEPLAEDHDQREPRRVRGIDAVEARRGAAERLEQAELVRAPEAVRREPLELGQDPLAGRLADEPGGGRARAPRSPRRAGIRARPRGAPRVGAAAGRPRTRSTDGPKTARREVGLAAERVDERPAGQGPRERVDREVPCREVLLDRVAVKRREVDRAARPGRRRARRRGAPRAGRLRRRQGARRGAQPARDSGRRRRRPRAPGRAARPGARRRQPTPARPRPPCGCAHPSTTLRSALVGSRFRPHVSS